jgi:regulator of RNase E activity RraA
MPIEVNTEVKRPAQEVVQGFRNLLEEYGSIVPGVSDVMNRLNTMSSDISPLFPGVRLVGVALTVKTSASDLAPVIKSLELVQSGDVIVVDTHNSKDTAFWGEMVTMEAQRKGAVGVILDSGVRDVVELKEMGFPVLCQGIAPNAAGLVGAGYINVPIQCGGAVVNPGDIVIVDDNGVVVVPRDEAGEVLERARKFLKDEEKIIKRIQAGESLGQILGIDRLGTTTIDHTRIYEEQG